MDFLEYEDIIGKIDGIINIKIIADNDNIQEVHILANKNRSPKQIVRDIESTLISKFNYKIDRKVISIAQIDSDECKVLKRIKFDGISISTSGGFIECSITLLHDDDSFTASETLLRTEENRKKVAALCTIKVVEKILGQAVMFDIQDVIINTNKGITYVNVLVNTLIGNSEETLIGAAIVNNETYEAIVKATLDALNRRIERVKC